LFSISPTPILSFCKVSTLDPFMILITDLIATVTYVLAAPLATNPRQPLSHSSLLVSPHKCIVNQQIHSIATPSDMRYIQNI
uniref:Ovule protein n=1 Tax=Haemonchus placei TaxID=6290 RepID=A0A0N4XBL3_HAEPC